MLGGVNLGLENIKADTFKKTADSRKKLLLVCEVNHDLKAFADR